MANNAAGQPILYVFGGNVDDIQYHDVWAYDASTDTWTFKSNGFEGSLSNGVGKIGGKFYISGGYNHGSGDFLPQRTLQAYDIAANRWIRKADIPLATAEGVTGVIDGKLYVLPGLCSGDGWPNPGYCAEEPTRRFYRYDPATNTWVTRQSAPHFHKSGGAAVINGKFYVVGGLNNFDPVADLDVYEPATNRWRTLAPMPTAGRAVATTLRGKLFVVQTSKAYSYDPLTNKWTTRAGPPSAGTVDPVGRVSVDGTSRVLLVPTTQEGPDPRPKPSYLYTP
ncbi:MAG: Kelch repeat-containing protein [Gemmatimonadales bacterium]